MKLSAIINAKTALDKLRKIEGVPYKTLYSLAMVAKSADKYIEFFAEEEKKLVQQYADKDDNGNPKVDGGSFTISDAGKKHEFVAKKGELLNVDADFDPSSLSLDSAVVEKANLNADELLALLEVVEVADDGK